MQRLGLMLLLLLLQAAGAVFSQSLVLVCADKVYGYELPVAGESYDWSVTGGVIQGDNKKRSVQVIWNGSGGVKQLKCNYQYRESSRQTGVGVQSPGMELPILT